MLRKVSVKTIFLKNGLLNTAAAKCFYFRDLFCAARIPETKLWHKWKKKNAACLLLTTEAGCSFAQKRLHHLKKGVFPICFPHVEHNC